MVVFIRCNLVRCVEKGEKVNLSVEKDSFRCSYCYLTR